jgi:hypothetical protein
MPSYARSFSEHLRNLVAPALAEAGFAFDGSRTFRRSPKGTSCVQIVNFQLGERFMEGKFTVNLAVYDPENAFAQVASDQALEHHCSTRLRQRLGVLIPRPLGVFARLPAIGFLFRPKDKWWRAGLPGDLDKATEAVVSYGLPWLDANTPNRA